MQGYKKQVALLISVIPEVEKEGCFALHGGTAINLFIRDMPRLSVDIDLTYIPIEGRDATFKNINLALERIKARIEGLPNTKVLHLRESLKLQITNQIAQIKIEVNQGMRGLINPLTKALLCDNAQEQFDSFCTMNIVSLGQLYGGKICAALDRQHPRDLFDVRYLLDNEGITEEIKIGFIYAMLCSKRPIQEILYPNLIDQNEVFIKQFKGMTVDIFTYEQFEQTRLELSALIHKNLSNTDKSFIISFEEAIPNWDIYDFREYPAVQWKLKNLLQLKNSNPQKHKEGVDYLKRKLNTI